MQRRLPAKSIAQARRRWRPSLIRAVSTGWLAVRRSSQGSIRVASKPPPIFFSKQACSVRAMRAPSIKVSALRTPDPLSLAPISALCVPRLQPRAAIPPPSCGRGARVVGQGQLDRPDRRERGRAEVAAPPLRPGAEQPALEAPAGAAETRSEGAGRRVGGVRRRERREVATAAGAEALLEPVAQGAPPESADVDDPRAGRSYPAPAGELAACHGAAAGAGGAAEVDPVEGVAAIRGEAERLGPEPAGRGVLIPIRIGADPPAALGHLVLPGPRLRGAERQRAGPDQRSGENQTTGPAPRLGRISAARPHPSCQEPGEASSPPSETMGPWHCRPRKRSPRAFAP